MKTITFNQPERVKAAIDGTELFLSGKELSGVIETNDGKTVSFRIIKDADGINFFQSGQSDDELYKTVPQMEFFQEPRNFDIFHVYLANLFLAK